ncbi:MAG: adenylate/guanylate cyclase domain-containing protein [Acidimicrobiales bacterium]
MTMLFADLVGYTTLAETRDPEAVKNLVDDCFERLVADVVAFGGVVDKIIGDAIVALFGAPLAHEDDPERAVRAALRMQQTLAAQAPVLGVELQMRIGVNTGEVLVGTLRSGGDYTAMGDVVNTASRLQSLAAPGQVLVGPATHAATAGVRFEPLGLLRAKGRDEPVPAWSAVEVLGPPGSRTRPSRGPIVGRDAELGLLRSLLAATTKSRRAAAVLLVGEAGLGKTRLVDEFLGHARAEGCLLLEGRCVPYGEVNVWAPLAEALRRASGVRPEDPPEATEAKSRSAVAAILGLPTDDPEVERLLHALSPLMGKAMSANGDRGMGRRTASRESEPVSQATEEALWALQTCIEKLVARRPLVIAIGELHWGDDVLLAFLDRIVERIADQPVLLLATARPELLSRWQPSADRNNRILLHVDPLDNDAAADLITHLAGSEISAAERETLVARSGGNPLWLEELAALASPGHAPGGPHENHLPDGLEPLPATLRGMVAARLDLVDPASRAVLEDAAVCGRAGSVAALEAMADGAGRPPIEQPLETLCSSGLLTMVHGRESWELRSELVREVAYGTLTKAERARRHARLASWLASRAGDHPRDDVLDDLSHHWAAAASLIAEVGGIEGLAPDTLDHALTWLERAAQRAIQRELWLPAATLLDTVVRLAPPGERWHRPAILLERARARVGMHDVEGASADLEAVREAATISGDDGLLMQSLVVRGDMARSAGRLGESESVLRQAITLARQADDEQTAVTALRSVAQTLIFAGDFDGAETVAAQALEGARRLADRRGEAWALQNLAWISFSRGDFDLARERLGESADAFYEIGDPGGRGWALGLLAWVHYRSGDLALAETLARRVLAESNSGDAWAEGVLRTLVASTRLWSGATDEAVEEAEAAVAACRGLPDKWPAARGLTVLGRARLAQGDLVGGRAALREAVDAACGLEDPTSAMFPRLAAAVALALQLGEAQEALDLIGDPTDEDFTRDNSGELRAALAVAHLQRGRLDEALRILVPLLGWEQGPPALRPSVAPWAALVLVAAGRRDEADALLDGVQAIPTTYLDRAWTAVARAALVADPDDRGRLLGDALAEVDSTGDWLAGVTIAFAGSCLGGSTPVRDSQPDRPPGPAGIGTEPPGADNWRKMWSVVTHGAN